MEFKYEQLADFCYYCGQICHTESIYNNKRADERNNALKEGQFGGWLRGLSGRYSSKRDEGRGLGKMSDLGGVEASGVRKVREEPPSQRLHEAQLQSCEGMGSKAVESAGMGEGVSERVQNISPMTHHIVLTPSKGGLGETEYGSKGREGSGRSVNLGSAGECSMGENGMLSEVMDLIEIPVCRDETRIPLADITSKNNGVGNHGKGKVSRKWKRGVRKVGDSRESVNSFGPHAGSGCTKRTWQLCDEEESENPGVCLKVSVRGLNRVSTLLIFRWG